MLRATSIVRRPAVKADKVADTLTLDHGARHRRRLAMTGEGGLSFLLDLDRSVALDDGDAIKLEDGRLVRVSAAPERLIEVRTENPLRLMRVAWHLGNRHVATEIADDALYLSHDHVLLEMVRGLGASAREVTRPFRPERGAYEEAAGDHGHETHDHGAHDHGHAGHDHGHEAHGREAHAHHDHGHHAGHDHADHHAHGPECGCGHDHAAHHHHEDLRPGHGAAEAAGGGTHAHSHAPAGDDHGHRHAHDHAPHRG